MQVVYAVQPNSWVRMFKMLCKIITYLTRQSTRTARNSRAAGYFYVIRHKTTRKGDRCGLLWR